MADVMSMNIVNSAIKKGETLIDTAMTLNAMHPDIIVVIRHQDSGAPNLLSQKVNCAVYKCRRWKERTSNSSFARCINYNK